MDNEIRIELAGPHGGIDPRAVADAINAVDKILRHITGPDPAQLNLTKLSIGSAVVAVQVDQARVDAFNDGVAMYVSHEVIPPSWTAEAVSGLIELGHVATRRGVSAVRLRIGDAVREIDNVIESHAATSIMSPRPSLGAVRGVLYRYNNGNKRSAGIKDYRTNLSIDVVFPQRLTAEIRQALDHEVEVWGEVHRDADDNVRSINAQGVEVIPSSRAGVTLDEVAGILGTDWTDGLDSVEWVRRQRD